MVINWINKILVFQLEILNRRFRENVQRCMLNWHLNTLGRRLVKVCRSVPINPDVKMCPWHTYVRKNWRTTACKSRCVEVCCYIVAYILKGIHIQVKMKCSFTEVQECFDSEQKKITRERTRWSRYSHNYAPFLF